MASSPTLLFLDLPPKTFVGIDLLSFNSSPNFHGISDVPKGLHFVYTGTDASLSIRHGIWLNIEATTTVHVLRWNPQEESLVIVPQGDAAAAEAFVRARTSRSQNLITYATIEGATSNLQEEPNSNEPTPENKDWPSLTSRLSPPTITRITPTNTLTSISSSPTDAETIPGLTHSEALSALPPDSHLNLLPINPKQTWAKDDIGALRTERARDHSWYLGHLMESISPGDRQAGAKVLLEELQFCFLMVLTLANYSCLEQWKRILSVVFSCRSALEEAEGYFVQVLKVLALQLGHAEDVEGGLFELREESGSAWLRGLVRRFRGVVEDVLGEDGELHKELARFEALMNERYGWELGMGFARRGMVQLEDGEMVEVTMDGADEDEEAGDWAPTIVDG